MSGELKIKASADLGGLGPQEGEAVSFTWSPLYSLSGLAVWCILAVALLARPNRSVQAWLILIPLVTTVIVWMGFKTLVHMVSSVGSMMDPMFLSLVIGLAVTGLAAPSLGRVRWPWRIIGFLAILAVVFLAAVATNGQSRQTWGLAVYYSISVTAVLLAVLLMRGRVKARFSAGRCFVWLGLGLVVISTLALLIVISGVLLSQRQVNLFRMLPQMLLVGLILGAILFAIVLPFALLMTLNDPWRQRFNALLGLPRTSDAPPPSPVS